MNTSIQIQIRELKQRIKEESDKYASAIKEGNFSDANAIKDTLTQLQIKMDKLTPYKQGPHGYHGV